jgi:hypothetical protein
MMEAFFRVCQQMSATLRVNRSVIGLIAKAQGCVAHALKSKKQSLM